MSGYSSQQSQQSVVSSHITSDDLMFLSNDSLFGGSNVDTGLSPQYSVINSIPSSHTPVRGYPSMQFLREFYDRNKLTVPKCTVSTQTEPIKDRFVLCHDIGTNTNSTGTNESDGPTLERDNKYLIPGTDEHLLYIDEVKRLIVELNLTEKCTSSILRRKKAIEKLVKQFRLTDDARKKIKVKLQNMLGQRRQEKAMKEKAELTGKTLAQVRKEQVSAGKPRQFKAQETVLNDIDFSMDEPPINLHQLVNPYSVPEKLGKGCVVVVAYDTKSYVGRVIGSVGEKCEVSFYAYKSIRNGIIYEKKKSSDIEMVARNFIFAAGLKLVAHESNFLVQDWQTIQDLYDKYVDDPDNFS